MDGTTHNGLGKLLSRSLTAKRRRNKTSSLAETVSSEDAGSLRARSIASQDEAPMETKDVAVDSDRTVDSNNTVDSEKNHLYESDPDE